MPLRDFLVQLVTRHQPSWRLSYPTVSRGADMLELRGSLPQTMHFGCARLTLSTGVLVFVDEDHRDGGDDEQGRVTLDADVLATVRSLLG
jgi:hypothetical protein